MGEGQNLGFSKKYFFLPGSNGNDGADLAEKRKCFFSFYLPLRKRDPFWKRNSYIFMNHSLRSAYIGKMSPPFIVRPRERVKPNGVTKENFPLTIRPRQRVKSWGPLKIILLFMCPSLLGHGSRQNRPPFHKYLCFLIPS